MTSIPKPLEDLISSLEGLPGIGPRSASRIAYYLLRAPERVSNLLSENLSDIKSRIKTCKNCFNYSEDDLCAICSSNDRDRELLMILEDPLDVVAFEKTQFKGLYHVLGGVISPINGIGPEEIRVKELLHRLESEDFKEIIIATNPNLEGESTAIFIKREIEKMLPELTISRLAMGLPSGADLEYADEITLNKALDGRTTI